MDKLTIEISLERYDELVKKEGILDRLMEGKALSLYLYNKA